MGARLFMTEMSRRRRRRVAERERENVNELDELNNRPGMTLNTRLSPPSLMPERE